jgi:LPXTG-motif cell wall-anchored protein
MNMITKNAPPLMGVLLAAILLFVLAKKKESDVASRSRSDPGSYPPDN